jgi:hypothetical protein
MLREASVIVNVPAPVTARWLLLLTGAPTANTLDWPLESVKVCRLQW